MSKEKPDGVLVSLDGYVSKAMKAERLNPAQFTDAEIVESLFGRLLHPSAGLTPLERCERVLQCLPLVSEGDEDGWSDRIQVVCEYAMDASNAEYEMLRQDPAVRYLGELIDELEVGEGDSRVIRQAARQLFNLRAGVLIGGVESEDRSWIELLRHISPPRK